MLELLAPAGNAETGIEAIRHGADAVYIGAPSHGARQAAANSLEDIRRVVDYAHIFDARVYVTVNTIIYDRELHAVEKMIRELYAIGVDALIVQDMGVLRMDIPPIALHASTQCDIRTPEKARFLQEAGFSQLVLARELSLTEIREICEAVTIPVETFVHGALCVSYSGRCSAGYAVAGRSGNRGECPQICRQPFTLTDADGKIIAKDKYLLSLKDFNASHRLDQLIEAGVNSFKIEGRLKETGYVKNVTAAYSRQLDGIVSRSDGRLRRSSFGTVELRFEPRLDRSFNRGFTEYCLSGTPKTGIASLHTPKSLGESIRDVSELKAGDGISYFDAKGIYTGVQVNGVEKGKIIGNRPFVLPKGVELRRTSSIEWKKLMASETARRTLALDITFGQEEVSAQDETGVKVSIRHGLQGEDALRPADYRKVFEKLGNTPFQLREFRNEAEGIFYPLSALTALRRELVETLLEKKKLSYKRELRKPENRNFPYAAKELDYRDNVANGLAREFYEEHGVEKIEPALETARKEKAAGKTVMTSRHCILRELGLCLKTKPPIRLPLTLTSGNLRLIPSFDCSRCEMNVALSR